MKLNKQELYPNAKCSGCPLEDNKVFFEDITTIDPSAIIVLDAPNVDTVDNQMHSGRAVEVIYQVAKGIELEKEFEESAILYACRCVSDSPAKTRKAIFHCKPQLEHDLRYYQLKNEGTVDVLSAGTNSMISLHKIMGADVPEKLSEIEGQRKLLKKIGTGVTFTYSPNYIFYNEFVIPKFAKSLESVLAPREVVNIKDNPPEIIHINLPSPLLNIISSFIEARKPVAFDIESSTAIVYDQIRHPRGFITTLGISNDVDKCYMIDPDLLYHPKIKEWFGKFNDAVNDGTIPDLIAHNGKYDIQHVREELGINFTLTFDTMLAHACIDENTLHGLKPLSKEYLGIEQYDQEIKQYVYTKKGLPSKVKFFDAIPYDILCLYAGWDVCCTLKLYYIFKEELIKQGRYLWPFKNVMMLASRALTNIERRGLKIDLSFVHEKIDVLDSEIEELLDNLRSIADKAEFNPNSPKQNAVIMYDKLGLPEVQSFKVKKRSTGAPAIDLIIERMKKREGDDWEHPFLTNLIEYRQLSKLRSTYLVPMSKLIHPDNHRIHTNLNLHIAKTGRLSSTDPNLQNTPKAVTPWGRAIRASYIAEEGKRFVKVDYSQAEMVGLAALAGDVYLINNYNNGVDMHSAVTKTILPYLPDEIKPDGRRIAKSINFRYVYGGGTPEALVSQYPLYFDLMMAHTIYDAYEKDLIGCTLWQNKIKSEVMETNFLDTVFGRRRTFPIITHQGAKRIQRQAINFPVQSVASDLTLISACILDMMGYNVVLLVHDEIISEEKEEEADDALVVMSKVMLCVAHAFCTGVTWKTEGLITNRWEQKENVKLNETAFSTLDWKERKELSVGDEYGLSKDGDEFMKNLYEALDKEVNLSNYKELKLWLTKDLLPN